MIPIQTITKLASSTTGVIFRRCDYDRCHLIAARFVCAGTWLAHQSSKMKQYRSRSDSTRQESDCPLCQQFGRGPCKDAFYSWYDCTEEAAASERSEDEITQDCAKLFDDFRTCLEQQSHITHQSDALFASDPQDLSELHDAWHQIIHSDLASVRREPFPPKRRPVIKRGTGSWLVSFSRDDLVLVFVQRDLQNGETDIVVAASVEHLTQNTIRIPSDKLGGSIIISAVYEESTSDGGSDLILCQEVIECHVP